MWSDKESEIDYLNYGEVSKLAVDILTAPNMLPVSLGIFGPWGSGKSSTLKLIEKELQELSSSSDNKFIFVNFDAWLYQGYDDARVAILEVIASKLNDAAEGNKTLLEKTKGLLTRINIFRAIGLIAEGTALAHGIPTGGLLAKGIGSSEKLFEGLKGARQLTEKDYQDASKETKELKETASGLLKDAQKITPPQQITAFRQEYNEVLKELGKTLVVVIDNLDRCLPNNTIHTLEAIRLFLFLPNTVFIIAADEDMIRGAVADYFKGANERHLIDYIDKLIQIPIRVPKVGIREIRAYLFMLFAIECRINEDVLEKLRCELERSLQLSWKENPIKIDKLLEITGDENKENLRNAFELADRITPILATSPSIQGNPRIVKLLLNVVKMRMKTAKRRGMQLDESIITKLVIFERCMGVEATSEFYQLIDTENGKPKIFKELEDSDEEKKSPSLPKSWEKNLEFIKTWSKLEPKLQNIDLRAAIYLSRETIPFGVYTIGLSPNAREALETLVKTKSISSPAASKALKNLPLEEEIPVMEEIIKYLRQISDWSTQPDGFVGACSLADKSPEAAKILCRYIQSFDKKEPWMNVSLKDKKWYENK
jgi:predicted KAP-like P-loop ATPase